VVVDEPGGEDTISILRGLRERFEVHHGVKIQDAALVAAATLAHRYITDRFLPDKAIDLVDEACAVVLVLHRDGQETGWLVGAVPERQLRQFLEPHLSPAGSSAS
jgi:ATP-dependent Clp protease ATP-binding subunit ClpA